MHCLLKLKYTEVYPILIPVPAVQNVDVASADFTEHVMISVPGLVDCVLNSTESLGAMPFLKRLIDCAVSYCSKLLTEVTCA